MISYLCFLVCVQVVSTSKASCPASSVTARRGTSGRASPTCPPAAAGWASLLQWSRVPAACSRRSRRRAEPRRTAVKWSLECSGGGSDGGDGDDALIERILIKRRPKLCTLMDAIPLREEEKVSRPTERRDAEWEKNQ